MVPPGKQWRSRRRTRIYLIFFSLFRRIGYGAAEALLEAGAHVTVISSSEEKVNRAVARLNNPNVQGRVGDVRNEEAFTQVLVSLAPLDHVVFSSVDLIIRGPLAEANLDEARHLFGVKFWGSIVTGKGNSNPCFASATSKLVLCTACMLTSQFLDGSHRQVRHCQARRIPDSYIWSGRYSPEEGCHDWRCPQRRCHHAGE